MMGSPGPQQHLPGGNALRERIAGPEAPSSDYVDTAAEDVLQGILDGEEVRVRDAIIHIHEKIVVAVRPGIAGGAGAEEVHGGDPVDECNGDDF